jgi:hypothetical protein
VAEYQAAGLDTPVIAIPLVPGLDLADTIRQLARPDTPGLNDVGLEGASNIRQ